MEPDRDADALLVAAADDPGAFYRLPIATPTPCSSPPPTTPAPSTACTCAA